MRHGLALMVVGLGTTIFSGCQDPNVVPASQPNHGDGAGFAPGHATESDGLWPFWPAKMRVYPLTRITTDTGSGRMMIEARIEFIDGYGDTTKCAGQIRVDLVDGGSSAESRPITQWNVDLRDLGVNDSHFDDITRTYLFKLQVQPEQLPAKCELRVYFLSADGRTLKAVHKLER